MLVCGPALLGEVPSLLRDAASKPVWIAVDVAVRDGSLDEQLLGEHLSKLRGDAQMNGAECRSSRTFRTDHFAERGSIRELTNSAKLVISARVTALKQGFLRGIPGMLLQLSGSFLKGPPVGDVHLFYPYAKIDTTEGAICARPVGEFLPPQIGDRMLVFCIVGDERLDGAAILYADPTHEIVHESAGGRIRLPNALGASPRSFDEIVGEARQPNFGSNNGRIERSPNPQR